MKGWARTRQKRRGKLLIILLKKKLRRKSLNQPKHTQQALECLQDNVHYDPQLHPGGTQNIDGKGDMIVYSTL